MVLRYVYMDESGTHDQSPAVSIAGYVFDPDQAFRFSRDWIRDLNRFNLPFAHMTDCVTGNAAYAKLSMSERLDSEKALIAHTRHRSRFGVAIAIDQNRYRELFGKGRYDFDIYSVCLSLAVKAVHEWSKETGYKGRFEYIFEAGHKHQEEANRIMNAIHGSNSSESYSSHKFVSKQDAPPLQAADMLAWQYAHYIKRRSEGFSNRRKDFEALLRPRDRLIEFGRDAVNQWRALMDKLDQETLAKLRSVMPDITDEELAWASSQMKEKS
jgi:hypothetical protein